MKTQKHQSPDARVIQERVAARRRSARRVKANKRKHRRPF
jgi:hypothetical protein